MFFDQIYHANYEQCHPTTMWNCLLVHYGPAIFTNKLSKMQLASMIDSKVQIYSFLFQWFETLLLLIWFMTKEL